MTAVGLQPAWAGTAALSVGVDEIQLWPVELDADRTPHGELLAIVGSDEMDRAAHRRSDLHARRVLVVAAARRTLLARYTDTRPRDVTYVLGPRGKPELERELAGRPRLRFNTTTAGGLALIAVTRGRDVGVDMEHEDTETDPLRIAGHVFASGECARLAALPETARGRAFLECWTCKEAYVKARGEGLHLAFDSFEVAFGPGRPAALLWVGDRQEDPQRFMLGRIAVPGHVVALCVGRRAPGETLRAISGSALPWRVRVRKAMA
jgi:4'-phosphopantetheinyl transferase